MTSTARTAADTGMPEQKPSLIFMADELGRILRLLEALRSACDGVQEDSLATLATVVIEEGEAFQERFETFRNWPAEVAA